MEKEKTPPEKSSGVYYYLLDNTFHLRLERQMMMMYCERISHIFFVNIYYLNKQF